MRTLLAVGVSAALQSPTIARCRIFRGANAAVVPPNLDAGTPPGYYYFPGYG
jgi:hypothetical protein